MLLICVSSVLGFVDMLPIHNLSVVTDQSTIVTLWYRSNVSENVHFFINADSTVVINSYISNYSDDFMLLSSTNYNEERVDMRWYSSGSHPFTWGFNTSNGTVYSQTVLVDVTGNNTDMTQVRKDFERFKQRMEDRKMLVKVTPVINYTVNSTPTAPINVTNNTVSTVSTPPAFPLVETTPVNVSPPVIVQPRPVVPPPAPEVQGDFTGALVGVGVLIVILGVGGSLLFFWLFQDEKRVEKKKKV